MITMLKSLIAFLLPIIGKAALQTAADTITQVAYPDRPLMRRRPGAYSRYTSYNRLADYAEKDVEETTRLFKDVPSYEGKGSGQYDADAPEPELTETHEGNPYHDVLMVAFDISGPNMHLVKQFLYNYMPVTGAQVFQGEKIYLDSYWIADDSAGDSDCMSAVFVNKGDQESARGFLRRGGLA